MSSNRIVLILAAALSVLAIIIFVVGGGSLGLGLGECATVIAIVTLKFWPYWRRGSVQATFPPRRSSWLLSIVALIGIIVIGKMAYSMYYQPMIQSLDSDPTAP